VQRTFYQYLSSTTGRYQPINRARWIVFRTSHFYSLWMALMCLLSTLIFMIIHFVICLHVENLTLAVLMCDFSVGLFFFADGVIEAHPYKTESSTAHR